MLAKLAAVFHSKMALALVGAVLVGGGGALVAGGTGAASHLAAAFAFHTQNGPRTQATHTAHDGEGDQESADQDHDLDGSVTGINSAGSAFVLTAMKEDDRSSSAVTVKVNGTTKFTGAAKAFGDLKVGMRVEADGTKQSDGSLLATTVEASNASGDDEQHEAAIFGSVVTVGATSFTVRDERGTTTIAVSSTTVFAGVAKRLADLKAGMHVVVMGAKQSDGSIAAQRVFVMAASADHGGD